MQLRGNQTSMSFQLPGSRRRAILSLAPLIDVTFIILIFFMLVTQFTHLAPVKVELGALQPAVALPDRIDETGRLRQARLFVQGDGKISFGTFQGSLGPGFAQALRAWSNKPEVNGEISAKPVLLIEPQENVPLQLLIDVMEEVQRHPAFVMKIVIPSRSEGPL